MRNKQELLVLIFSFWCHSAFSQEISSLTLKNDKVSIGEAVSIILGLKNGASTNTYCGLELNFGDGVIETIRVQQNAQNMTSIDLAHTYTNPGRYTINVEGKFHFQGISSAIPCSGQSKQAVVNVIDNAAEKSKEETRNQIKILSEKEAELQKKEKELQAMQLQLLSARESELQRKEEELQQKIKQMDREKQMSSQAPVRREKKIEHPIQATESINTPRTKPSAPVSVQTIPAVSNPVSPTAPVSTKGYKLVDGF